MVNSLENIDKSKVYVDRIEGLDEVVEGVVDNTLIGAVSTITKSDLTAGKVLVSDNNGKVAAGSKGINDLQDTLVSGNNIKTINNISILGSGNINVESGADTSLSNLTTQGQNITNWSSNVTNCITEIPQDIKLELNNGVLTLKAGSKVYIPNGFESDGTTKKFDVVITDRDVSIPKWNNSAPGLISITSNRELWISLLEQQYSGGSAPTSQWILWYDTTNNLIKSSHDAGSSWKEGYCLPIAICTSDSSKWTSIDQVFNGFGYIGSTVFALPGVKGLIPNGRNKDGTLKNIEFTVSNVILGSRNLTSVNIPIWLRDNNTITFSTGIYYDEKSNLIVNTTAKYCQIGVVDMTGGKITSFSPKTVFHAVDDNTVVHKTGDEIIGGDKTFVDTVIHKNTKATINNPPSIESFIFTDYIDNDNNRIGIIGSRINSAGVRGTYLQAGNENQLAILTNGTDAWTWSPASDKNHSVVTTEAMLKANDDTMYNYVKLGNGLLIQWGHIQQNSQQLNITFPIPFMNTAYRMFTQDAGTASGYSYAGVTGIGRTTTGATLYSYYSYRYYDWLAIGFWY